MLEKESNDDVVKKATAERSDGGQLKKNTGP